MTERSPAPQSLEIDRAALVAALRDQRITGFNAVMELRERAAAELSERGEIYRFSPEDGDPRFQLRDDVLEEIARYVETWRSPANPTGRRAKLAADIRALKNDAAPQVATSRTDSAIAASHPDKPAESASPNATREAFAPNPPISWDEMKKALESASPCVVVPPEYQVGDVTYCTVRDGVEEWHLECRFVDGQKFAAVTVDRDHEELAHLICDFLNRLAPVAATPKGNDNAS